MAKTEFTGVSDQVSDQTMAKAIAAYDDGELVTAVDITYRYGKMAQRMRNEDAMVSAVMGGATLIAASYFVPSAYKAIQAGAFAQARSQWQGYSSDPASSMKIVYASDPVLGPATEKCAAKSVAPAPEAQQQFTACVEQRLNDVAPPAQQYLQTGMLGVAMAAMGAFAIRHGRNSAQSHGRMKWAERRNELLHAEVSRRAEMEFGL